MFLKVREIKRLCGNYVSSVKVAQQLIDTAHVLVNVNVFHDSSETWRVDPKYK